MSAPANPLEVQDPKESTQPQGPHEAPRTRLAGDRVRESEEGTRAEPRRPAAEILSNGSVLVRVAKCVLVLEPLEIACVLQRDRGLWIRALRRGKCVRRCEQSMRRR